MSKVIPAHQWTHDGDKVLCLRCCNPDGTSHGGYVWPQVGDVAKPEQWSPKAECGDGLHGWPWGTAFGDGKEPDYKGLWIVFAASPEDVIDLGGKVKVRECTVIYRGTYQEALSLLLPGYHSWVLQASSGAASATGYIGAASATGYSGAASATGGRGAASATGDSGAASATGYSGAASATGDRGAASATGDSGAASATGDRGAASATGGSGAASATGDSGAASATGNRGAASATGYSGAACLTGEYGILEIGPDAIGAVTAYRWYWRVQTGAVVVWRRGDQHVLFVGDAAKDGETLRIQDGCIVEDWT